MKRFLILIAMLSVLFLGIGTAHAVLGVVDDVPGTDVVIPIICEKGGTLNTLYALAEVLGDANTADIVVYDVNSNWVYDSTVSLTGFDILPGDCQSLVAGMSAMQQAQLEVTIDPHARTYYAGYVVFYNWDTPDDTFISWVYLVDLIKGFASGFNGYQAEGFVTNQLCEFDWWEWEYVCQTAWGLIPRYYIMNDKTETWNWWIVIYGDNDPTRFLVGYICNEEEDCVSLNIPVPDELNIINVEPYVPAALHPAGYPKAGMGWFINFEADYDNTVYGFAYQRAESDTLSATWDVIHPIHGWYFPTRW